MPSVIHRGVIVGYDQEAMTCTILDSEPSSPNNIYRDVICLFDRYDEKNNAFSFRAPSEGSPCIFVTFGSETVLLGLYPPLNVTTDDNKNLVSNSMYASIDSRKPQGMTDYKVKPGTVIDTNSNGSTDSFTDTIKKIVIFPEKLYSLWNLMNYIWENMCYIFRLYSGPMDVTCEVTENENDKTISDCNTTIKVRKSISERTQDSTTMIDLRMGTDADVIQLNINGKPFVHVDGDRNVIVIAKKIDLTATQINYNVTADPKVEGHNGEINMLNADSVHLP